MLNTANTNSYLKGNIENQNKFWSGESNLMIYANFCSNVYTQPDFRFDLIDIPSVLSMDFLDKHAYEELGIYATKKAESSARFHMNINDDWHPHIYLHWGTGFTASIFSSANVIFQDSTSYTKGHIIDDIETFKYKAFQPENRLTRMIIDFWKGVEDSIEYDFIAASPFLYRSPLDIANDMRG